MSERTDQIIEHHLNRRPGARHAHQHDQFFHTEVEMVRSLLGVMESEMRREGVPYDSAGRVLNGIMHVCLSDWERAKLRRERSLLLADMASSASDVTISQLFTELAEGSPVRDDVTPERMDAWLEKEQARLREATRSDLSPEERPVGGEENNA
jgi:hypothetical protein